MTTDLLVTFQNGSRAVCGIFSKASEELKDIRVLEKLEIERAWWEAIGVTFKVFTGNQQVKYQSHNILWATDLERHGLHEQFMPLSKTAAEFITPGNLSRKRFAKYFLSSST